MRLDMVGGGVAPRPQAKLGWPSQDRPRPCPWTWRGVVALKGHGPRGRAPRWNVVRHRRTPAAAPGRVASDLPRAGVHACCAAQGHGPTPRRSHPWRRTAFPSACLMAVSERTRAASARTEATGRSGFSGASARSSERIVAGDRRGCAAAAMRRAAPSAPSDVSAHTCAGDAMGARSRSAPSGALRPARVRAGHRGSVTRTHFNFKLKSSTWGVPSHPPRIRGSGDSW